MNSDFFSNIVIITEGNPYNQSNASSNRLISLMEGLRRCNIQIRILIATGYTSAEERQLFGKIGKKNGIQYVYLSPTMMDGIWKRRFYNYIGKHIHKFTLPKRIALHLTGKEDILWPTNEYAILYALVKIKPRFPHIKYFVEQSEFMDIYRGEGVTKLQAMAGRKFHVFFEQAFFPLLDGMALMTKTLVSQYTSMLQDGKPKLLHLPMTVDLSRFSTSFPCPTGFQKPYIAYVGVMNDAKDGITILIRAFSSLVEKFPDYRLYLIGPWQYDTPAQLALIADLQLEDKVIWKKELPRDAIPPILSNADVLVLPRPDSKQAQGGFPTKLGEYLATGRPVCATTVGEIPDYLTDGVSVFFATPGSSVSFASAMERALSDMDTANQVGAQGKQIAEKHFNMAIQSDNLNNFLRELIAQ